MAKILDKNPIIYKKEKDGFVRDLQQFHDSRGTPFRRPPTLGGKEVDLYLLYTLVTAKGGWIRVNNKNEWEEILTQLWETPVGKCINGGIALKQIYLRYLDKYEKVHFLGEDGGTGSGAGGGGLGGGLSDGEDDSGGRHGHKRWSARALHAVPHTYNYQQHNIADSIRTFNGLSDKLHKSSDYDRLALSLISPLPNEQDFAVNVCTLLCNEGKHTLKLEKCPILLDYLIAHTGVYNHESLRPLFTEIYSKIRKHSLNNFWNDALEKKEWIDLTNEKLFKTKVTHLPRIPLRKLKRISEELKKSVNNSENSNGEISNNNNNSANNIISETLTSRLNSEIINLVEEDNNSDSELFAKEIKESEVNKLRLSAEDRELFCTGLSLGTQDYVGQRVLQIAQILRNLSFTEENIGCLSKSRTFLRFMLLCIGSRWNSIHQLGLDMLCNISSQIVIKKQQPRLAECILNFITTSLHNQDRSLIISCLEILNKFSQNEENEDYLLKNLDRQIYRQVCSFLTLHDVMLLIYTLECLYSLSGLGERACDFIVEVHGIIDTLVSLVTVEGKSYGPKACIGMKLVETVSGNIPTQNLTQLTSTPTLTQTSIAQSSNIAQLTPIQLPTNKIPQSSPIVRNVVTSPQKIMSTVTTTTTNASSSNSSNISQQHAHQQTIHENEQFALAYLRATYEPCTSGRIEQQELYKQYLNACGKIGRKGVIAPLHFPRCVRSVFGGTVGPNPTKGNPSDPCLYYDGIKTRLLPLVINCPTPQPAAPPKATPGRKAGQRKIFVHTIIDNSQDSQDSNTATSTTTTTTIPPSPASPILKAQLSAPPKPKESPTKDVKSNQALSHPHLSQALLSSSSSGKETVTTNQQQTQQQQGAITTTQSNTSLIKSLLATKVTTNDCMKSNVANLPATNQDTQNVATQVVQRQQAQRLLAQQNQPANSNSIPSQPIQTFTAVNKKVLPKPLPKTETKIMKTERINGANSLDESDITSTTVENHITSIGGVNSAFKGKKEPPQPPPPPLAPLSGINNRAKTPKMEIEDSDSTGNNSIASSTGISVINANFGGISSTEDGENSLTSFEGILNGIPNSVDIDAPNEDSNSKDSLKISKKPLMLADLLEKKVDKEPVVNGVIGKELRIGEKGLELVDKCFNKILSKENNPPNTEIIKDEPIVKNEPVDITDGSVDIKIGVKRSATDDISEIDEKKPNLGPVNGEVDSPKEPNDNESTSSEENGKVCVSATAANLYAALAADALEDEDEELLTQETMQVDQTAVQTQTVVENVVQPQLQPAQTVQTSVQVPIADPPAAPQSILEETNTNTNTPQVQVAMQAAPQMVLVQQNQNSENNGQSLVIAAPRQIIVSQGQIQQPQQVLITAGGQIALSNQKGPNSGVPVIVQGQNRGQAQMIVSQGSNPSLVVSQGPQGQIQLIQTQGSGQNQQFVISGGVGGQPQLMVAQPQTALVQGHQQTVLVAQTPNQGGTGSKTIIILQPQSGTGVNQQKIVVTPQGQQVVVTQVQRPLLQASNLNNNIQNLGAQNLNLQNSVKVVSATNAGNISSNGIGKVFIKTEGTVSGSRPQTPGLLNSATSSTQGNISNNNNIDIKNESSNSQSSPPPMVNRDLTNPYVCEWRGCTCATKFKSANEVYMHACESHCPTDNEEVQCQWERCDNLKRKRFSLMTHLLDRHCNSEQMKLMHMRRKQLLTSGRTEIPAPQPAPQHPGYAPDAALHAIKRHALEFVNPKELQQKKAGSTLVAMPQKPVPEQDDNEGPVTKSIRLTASLILRNLVIFSNNSKRYLRRYEPHLAGVALSNVESSRTIAQLLYDLNANSSHR